MEAYFIILAILLAISLVKEVSHRTRGEIPNKPRYFCIRSSHGDPVHAKKYSSNTSKNDKRNRKLMNSK